MLFWAFSSSLQLSCFLNSFRFFYTQDSLVKGQVSERRGILIANSRSLSGTFVSNCRVLLIHFTFFILRSVWQKIPSMYHYLDFSSVPYLHKSNTRASLVRSALVSKVPSNFDFFLLLYLHESGTRSSKRIALSQSYFASFIVLYIDMTTSCPSNT